MHHLVIKPSPFRLLSDIFSIQTDSSSSSDAEATMEEIFGVKPAIEAQRDHPPDLEADSGIVDVCFHPSVELLSMATMDGEVIV